MEEKLLDINFGNDFLDMIPKATKANIDIQKSETTLN